MSLPPLELFENIYRRHGHRCPMSTLGGRIGWAACRALENPAGARGVYFIATCALDGIRETTGFHEGEGTLRVENRGEHRLRMIAGDEGVDVELLPEALAIAGRYRQCSEALDRERKHMTAAQAAVREAHRERVLQDVLDRLWSLPDPDLLQVRYLSLSEIEHA